MSSQTSSTAAAQAAVYAYVMTLHSGLQIHVDVLTDMHMQASAAVKNWHCRCVLVVTACDKCVRAVQGCAVARPGRRSMLP